MANCFDNLITLDGTCDGEPAKSSVSMTALGITRSFLSEIITQDFESVEEFFDVKKDLAIQLVSQDIIARFADRYKTITVVDGFTTGKVNENKILVPAESKMKGQLFERTESRSYLDCFVSEVSLYLDYTGDVDVIVYDVLQGLELDTITVPCEAGKISTVYPHKTYKSYNRKLQLAFIYDATGIDSFKTTLSSNSCTKCSPQYRIRNSYENVYSVSIDLSADVLRKNFSFINETGGLIVTHSLQCNHTDWICAISNLLALPIAYKLAALCIEFGLLETPNTRANTTETNSELLKQRLDSAEFSYREKLDNILKSISVPQDPTCFECRSASRHKIVLP